ncbi:hypothetical protein GT037_010223 [Alternaria burnsii]|uniref:Uncharacterized protein n=1 Tax=Alternaria burnsii TaxID=1187904 RepID=A0A8H7EBD7_9PLEO|nr:uncharacterized protein GT037_010223 [Alternaria burnsii]KAF7671701.1 hypothetical protein GT037_010223 [Alternaria burnsii]
MDWARDNAWLSDQNTDLERIFTYAPGTALAVKIVKSNGYHIQIWSLETDDEWDEWLCYEANENHLDHGLHLILARRAGESSGKDPTSQAMSYTEWLGYNSENTKSMVGLRCAQNFAALGGKQNAKQSSKQADIRKLPFSQNTFKSICQKFRVHSSITKAITRSASPSFTCEKVIMNQAAYVYNCRTSKEWPLDMALSATSYPEKGSTYAILYGCVPNIERSLLRSLNSVRDEACHPLLMSGIFAELELLRHTRQVSLNIIDVESKIFALDFESGDTEGLGRKELEKRNEAKRNTWLDMTYLRNSLITTNVQNEKMSKHAADLSQEFYHSIEHPRQSPEFDELETKLGARSGTSDTLVGDQDYASPIAQKSLDHSGLAFVQRMRQVGKKIEIRLNTIREEYEVKIRDCTMRVDGMAMATQWSHSETAVEMALATNRESRVMKSISLVTMVFLPGTFFATVFSMTFFDWSGDDGKTRVSNYLWVYIVVTIVFTALTIGSWYFFVIHRRASEKSVEDEKC